MKERTTFLAAALMFAAVGFAQRTPTHPLDIKDANFSDLVANFTNWEAGKPFGGLSTIDEQFYISRQRPLARISGPYDYKADGEGDSLRHMCLWVPLDDPTSKWKALPRYCFEGDNFSNWSYVTIHGNWTGPWFRVTAGLSDVAHKNGVAVGCVMSVPWNASVYADENGSNDYSRIFGMLTKTDAEGNFVNAEKFVRFLQYYGIDGVGVNSEFHSDRESMDKIQQFFAQCHKEAENLGWRFQLHWYDGTNDYGNISFDQGLNSNNSDMFGDSANVVTDMLFANYNWYKSTLTRSENTAADLGRSSYDYYAGFDIQGRALRNNNWQALKDSKISVGFWGAHSQSLIHQSATDNGTSDVAIQQTYLDKQELIFSGGHRNPAYTPAINTSCDLSNASLANFHGLSQFLSAKSTIQQVPFVSRFNLGNGLKFRNEGRVTFDHKWHNIATQDIMPTWRWWIVNGEEKADQGNLVAANLTWDDAWFGGSCLRLSGATDLSRVKLFKTAITAQPSYTLSITYKTTNDLDPHAKLFVAKRDALTDYKEVAFPAAEKFGEWTTFTTTLGDLGLASGDELSMIGLTVEGAPADYNLLVGEIALRDPAQTFAPVAPAIKEVEFLRGKGSSLDFKMRYAAKDETGYVKTYNDEVDTWYYEIYMQQENQPEQLLTATTSWAAYVIDAPLVSGYEGRRCRFGVRAVSPDGVQKSEISWSEMMDVPYNAPSNEVMIDKPVIKPNETFTIGLEDAMANPAQKWTLTNAETGETVYETANVSSFSTSLPNIGTYDLTMVNSEGLSTTLRGKVIVSPESTGAVPAIDTLYINKDKAEVGEDVTYSYAYRKGEGTVSRALTVKDPDMLMIPGDVQKGKTYSYALWVKINSYAHDKQGTNLISKNTIEDQWPHNNWGDLWVQIRPETESDLGIYADGRGPRHAANEVSFNTFGWTHHDTPWDKMMSTGYSLNPGVWNHIVVTEDGNNQTMYFNGKRVAKAEFTASSRREESTDSRIDQNAVANIFIGGGGVYKAGLNGWIDEVQVWDKALTDEEVLQAMKGFDDEHIPAGLQAYYNFEDLNPADSTFANHGLAGAQYTARVVRLTGSGGESTASAAYQTQGADNSVTGYPGISGTLDIKTVKTLTVNGARISSESDEAAVVTYATPGTYSATLRLANDWGEATQTLADCITIDVPNAINAVEATDGIDARVAQGSVNFRFGMGGRYTVQVVSADGKLLQANSFDAAAGQVVNVALKGNPGLCVVKVVKDGKLCKAIKVIKK